ncbi:MAG TPA: TlpA disulfide reductase family protein [Thermoanaerobaculia bacterium]|nr:TlpA disulfide reductase family protein [Thermoanaerobaculia bacterium]
MEHFILAAALLGPVVLAAPASPAVPIVAQTGDPVLREGEEVRPLFPTTEEEYRGTAERLAKREGFVPIRARPPGLTPRARFGTHLVLGRKNLSWILDEDSQGPLFYFDANANGDFTDDPPVRFSDEGGQRAARLRMIMPEGGRPFEWKLVLETSPVPLLKLHGGTLRRGVLRVGERSIPFALQGANAIYDFPHLPVLLDLDADGRFDPRSESYTVGERYVTLGEVSYRFSVDRYGRSLSLEPLAQKLPPRPTLAVGSLAPDFAVKDMDGNLRRLSDYRGKLVLLDFWSTWCSACVKESSQLASLYGDLRGRGFEIVGISDDTAAEMRKLTAERGLTWPQIVEGPGESLVKLFRIYSVPTYFLIGRDGTILADDTEFEANRKALRGVLEKYLPPPPPAR